MDIALDGLFSMLWADPATFVVASIVIIAAIFFFGFFRNWLGTRRKNRAHR